MEIKAGYRGGDNVAISVYDREMDKCREEIRHVTS
jgi:hypothetical protein